MRSTFFFVTPILLTMAILCAECNAFAPPPPSMLRKSKKIARTALHMPDLENPSGPFDGATSRVVPRGGASTAMAKLTSVANFAGMLCVIDCTVLPGEQQIVVCSRALLAPPLTPTTPSADRGDACPLGVQNSHALGVITPLHVPRHFSLLRTTRWLPLLFPQLPPVEGEGPLPRVPPRPAPYR